MGSQTVWLPTVLYTALIRLQLNDFTAQECVIAVFGDKLKRPSKHKYYGLIYRHLNKLVGMGLLNRRSVGNKWFRPNYVKTPLFDKVTFQEDLPSSEVPVTPVEQKAVVEVRNEGLRENWRPGRVHIDLSSRNTKLHSPNTTSYEQISPR